MSDTQVLLTKIAALRQQLESIPREAPPGREEPDGTNRVQQLERQIAAGTQQSVLLDSTLRQLVPGTSLAEGPILPRQLTVRAHRILENGRGLLDQLRNLADSLDSPLAADAEPLTSRYRETAAMAEAALRMVQAFPDAPSAQLRLCEGLEAILAVVAERVAALSATVARRRLEASQVESLAELLTSLAAGTLRDVQPFVALAQTVTAEALQGAPLRFPAAAAEQPARAIACHGLVTAQVLARAVRHDLELRSLALEAVLAALLHDAGMLAVPPEILAQPGPLDDSQRRAVEAHTRIGAEWMTHLLPEATWLAEAALAHHERLDGTGYPAGWRELQMTPLTRLLAVCDVYAALCAPRPYRPARETRTALADTLLLAEQGALDRFHAERLLQLSFYPVGSVVELGDGAVGVVVATHLGRRDLQTPARPVVALLTDSQGRPLSMPQHLDLAQSEGRSIVRTLPRSERREILGRSHPELV
jgi:HD-GYP domain-containing protein (c-di-GMP phosphodiesterase class II)